MTHQYGTAERNASLDAIETSIGVSPTLEIRTGTPPANCAAAATGTVLATMTLPSDWMSAAAAGAKALLGTWQDTAADASGIAGYFRISAVGTGRWQALTSEPWAGSKAYLLNQQASNGGNVYRCTTAGTSAAAGGPTGTGSGITDGGAVWNYIQTGVDMSLDNTSLNVGQTVSFTALTITAGGA